MQERKQTATPWTQRKRRRELRKGPILTIVVFLLVGAVGSFWHWKRSLIYQPLTTVETSPATTQLPFDAVLIGTPTNSALSAWYVPAAPGDAAASGRKVVLYCHGFDGNMAAGLRGNDEGGIRLRKIRLFHELGMDVLAFDYRGFGNSPGWPTEDGLHKDAFAAYFYLTETRNISSTNIYLFGESLGAAVALEVASRGKGAGVIIEGAPVSADYLLRRVNPNIPWHKIPLDKFDALNRVGRVSMPLLIIHSEDDEKIPFAHAQELHKQAREPKQLVSVFGSHSTSFVTSFDTYHDAIRKFVGVTKIAEAPKAETTNAEVPKAEELEMRLSAPEPPGTP